MSIYDPLSIALGIEPQSNLSYLNEIIIEEYDTIEVYKSVWTGCKHTDHSKRLISMKATGRKKPNGWCERHSEKIKGRKHTVETRKKISISLSGQNNPMYGMKHSDEDKRIRRKVLGQKVIVNDIEYDSKREAAKFLNVSRSTIDYWLKNGKAFDIQC